MSATPEQDAYLALLRLPHGGPRSTAALQTAMATLRDYIAEAVGKDAELVQDISEQVARMPPARTEIERPWFEMLLEREAVIRAQAEQVRVLEAALKEASGELESCFGPCASDHLDMEALYHKIAAAIARATGAA